MFCKKNFTRMSMVFFGLILLIQPKLSYADWGLGINFGGRVNRHEDRHFYRYHDHPNFGLHISFIPDGCLTVWVGGSRYYYYDGLYYRRIGADYVIVEPPIGAYVSIIPPDYQVVVINGKTYYTDNGIYYVLTRRHGYKVVRQPVVVVQPTQVIVTQPTTTVVTTQAVPPAPVAPDTEDSFTVNIPSDKGGYTTVVIKKSGNGFVGPQGEFYSEFPKVTQLKAMYGK